MFIGSKLDIGFSEHALYRQLYGDRKILDYLRHVGFSAVETPFGPETEPESLREHVIRCREAFAGGISQLDSTMRTKDILSCLLSFVRRSSCVS